VYDFLLAVHLLCAVLWVGGGATLHIMGRRARRAGGDAMLAYTREAAWMGRLYAPLAMILLVAGILLVGETGYEHSDLFITLAYLGWLTSVIIGMFVYPRLEKAVVGAAESGGTESPGFEAAFGRYGTVNVFEQSVLLLIVIDMAVKPGI
jgi:uncharacterized membrane protein